MKKLILLIPFAFISCNSEMSLEKEYEVTYSLHIDENNKYNESLLDNIKIKMSELKNVEAIQKIKICDSLSKEYFNYLTTFSKVFQKFNQQLL